MAEGRKKIARRKRLSDEERERRVLERKQALFVGPRQRHTLSIKDLCKELELRFGNELGDEMTITGEDVPPEELAAKEIRLKGGVARRERN